ncbi:MAG: hypothetical protein JW778_04680 [Candidatus Altiarchaeota archaeon]|nr:hypothetical protein [Candidatus Altiarchaeota archaeon]
MNETEKIKAAIMSAVEKRGHIIGIVDYSINNFGDFSFECPSNWEIQKMGGNVDVVGPFNGSRTYNARLSVLQLPKASTAHIPQFKTLVSSIAGDTGEKSYSEHILEYDGQLEEFNASSIFGVTSNLMRYTKYNSTNTQIKEVQGILKKESISLKIVYSCDKSDFDKYLEAYERLKSSFCFLD